MTSNSHVFMQITFKKINVKSLENCEKSLCKSGHYVCAFSDTD